jgi:hypothetical protein
LTFDFPIGSGILLFYNWAKRDYESAKKYRGFCQRYKPKLKTASKSYWGSKLLAGQPPLGEFKSQNEKSFIDFWFLNLSEASARYRKAPN